VLHWENNILNLVFLVYYVIIHLGWFAMRSFIILLLISILFSGCGILSEVGIPGNESPFSHLKDFTIVDDDIFIETIEQLDTPEKIFST